MVGVAVVGGQPQWVGDREWEHQRPDVTLNEDRCRVRSGNGLLVKGLFRRLAISLFMDWRLRQPKPHQRSLTDFQSLMGENHLAPGQSGQHHYCDADQQKTAYGGQLGFRATAAVGDTVHGNLPAGWNSERPMLRTVLTAWQAA